MKNSSGGIGDAIMFLALLVFMWACMGGFTPTGPINGPCGGGGRAVPMVPDTVTQ